MNLGSSAYSVSTIETPDLSIVIDDVCPLEPILYGFQKIVDVGGLLLEYEEAF